MRIANGHLIGLRLKLIIMVITVGTCSTSLDDNNAVICNMQYISIYLKKKHNMVEFNEFREYVLAGFVRPVHIYRKHNPSDVTTNPLGPMDIYIPTLSFLYNLKQDNVE